MIKITSLELRKGMQRVKPTCGMLPNSKIKGIIITSDHNGLILFSSDNKEYGTLTECSAIVGEHEIDIAINYQVIMNILKTFKGEVTLTLDKAQQALILANEKTTFWIKGYFTDVFSQNVEIEAV